MPLLWHIVRKDLRRLWPWLTLLVAATLARYLHSSSFIPTTSAHGLWQSAGIVDNCLLGLAFVSIALAAASLVHEDPVTSDRAFWPTRPISGLRLLLAKLITLIFALIGLPLLLSTLWCIFQGFSCAETIAELPSFFARYSATAFSAFFCALFTRNIGSFILTAVVSTLIVTATFVGIESGLPRGWRVPGDTRPFLQFWLIVVSAVFCAVIQYRTRRTRVTVGIVLGAFALWGAVGAFWRWPLFPKQTTYDRLPPFEPTLPISVYLGAPGDSSALLPKTTLSEHIYTFTVDNIPGDAFVQIFEPVAPTGDYFFRIDHEEVLKSITPPDSSAVRQKSARFKISTDFLNGKPPVLPTSTEVHLRFLLRRILVANRLPLAIGSTARSGARSMIILSRHTSRSHSAPSLQIFVREKQPEFLVNSDGEYAERNVYYLSSLTGLPNHGAYFLVSADTVIAADSAKATPGFTTDGLQQFDITVTFPGAFTDADLARYELVKIIAPALGTFERTVMLSPTTLHD
jgi:hypothetical protein